MTKPVVRIAPNNPVFDLPVIVGIEERLFEKAGLDVSFSATYADRERDSAEKPVLSRLKEQMFECGSADSYNVCEWASIDRLERGERGGSIAALRAAVAAQAILTFDEKLQTPRDLSDVPVVVQELTGSHYTTLQMLESAVGREHVKIQNGSLPYKRWEGLRNRTYRAVAVMEPFISLGLKEGAHIIAASFYRGGEVVAAELTPEERKAYYDAENQAVDLINGDFYKYERRLAAARAAARLRPLQARRLLRSGAVQPRLRLDEGPRNDRGPEPARGPGRRLIGPSLRTSSPSARPGARPSRRPSARRSQIPRPERAARP
ncbi:MAG: nitrate ABC transporter substrate-binding protein [Betaproteobacteria bacterium]|nr:MAG: nitrate ABC transporter substrate-binding protein [Betaproteobacteria bacterium]